MDIIYSDASRRGVVGAFPRSSLCNGIEIRPLIICLNGLNLLHFAESKGVETGADNDPSQRGVSCLDSIAGDEIKRAQI